jgi:hypothetical protein
MIRRTTMFGIPWRLIVGIILGAVIVKESHRASGAYDSVRAKVLASLDKLRTKPTQNSIPTGDGPESSTAPVSN